MASDSHNPPDARGPRMATLPLRELTDVLKENDRLRGALTRIRDHGKTHDEPCWAIQNGDCADVMQEIARAALEAGER